MIYFLLLLQFNYLQFLISEALLFTVKVTISDPCRCQFPTYCFHAIPISTIILRRKFKCNFYKKEIHFVLCLVPTPTALNVDIIVIFSPQGYIITCCPSILL